MSYSYTNEAKEIKDLLIGLKRFTEKAVTRIEELQEHVESKQMEVQDYLHLAELTDFNAAEGYRIAKDIQDAQRTRREAKDLIALYEDLKKIIPFQDITEKSDTAVGAINSINKGIHHRFYSPKVRKDLTLVINKKCIKNVPKNMIAHSIEQSKMREKALKLVK